MDLADAFAELNERLKAIADDAERNVELLRRIVEGGAENSDDR
jgi:hypothetical protein